MQVLSTGETSLQSRKNRYWIMLLSVTRMPRLLPMKQMKTSNKKQAIFANGMLPIICCRSLETYVAGKAWIRRCSAFSCSCRIDCRTSSFHQRRLWATAIGTGKSSAFTRWRTKTRKVVRDVVAMTSVKKVDKVRVHGGSVKPENACWTWLVQTLTELFVGGASRIQKASGIAWLCKISLSHLRQTASLEIMTACLLW